MNKIILAFAAVCVMMLPAGAVLAQNVDGLHSVAVGPDGAVYLLYGGQAELSVYRRVNNQNIDLGIKQKMTKIRVAPDGDVIGLNGPEGIVLRIHNGQAENLLVRGDRRISEDAFAAGRFHPDGLAVAKDGTIYVGDSGNGWLLSIDGAGNVTRLAGIDPVYQGAGAGAQVTAESRGLGDGPGLSAKLNNPSNIAVGPNGAVFIAEASDGLVRMYSQGTLTTIAGILNPDGTRQAGFRDGPASMALLGWNLGGIAVDGDGNIFVMDNQSHCIRQISWDERSRSYFVYTLAGSPKNQGVNKDGKGFKADFGGMWVDMAVDPQKNLYLIDSGSYNMRTVSFMSDVKTISIR